MDSPILASSMQYGRGTAEQYHVTAILTLTSYSECYANKCTTLLILYHEAIPTYAYTAILTLSQPRWYNTWSMPWLKRSNMIGHTLLDHRSRPDLV